MGDKQSRGRPNRIWGRKSDLPNLAAGEKWLLSYDATDITLSVIPTGTPEPGTFVLLGSGILGFAGLMRRKINL